MIESPLIKEITAKSAAQALQKSILRFLERRFGPVPEDVAVTVRTIYEENKLDELAEVAAYCPDVQAFRASLQGSQR
jgi:hypothetical protein